GSSCGAGGATAVPGTRRRRRTLGREPLEGGLVELRVPPSRRRLTSDNARHVIHRRRHRPCDVLHEQQRGGRHADEEALHEVSLPSRCCFLARAYAGAPSAASTSSAWVAGLTLRITFSTLPSGP